MIYFKKITKASHEPDYSYEIMIEKRELQSSPSVSDTLNQDQNAKPVILKANFKMKNIFFPISSWLALLSSRKYLQRGV